MYINIYYLDPAKIPSKQGLAWEAALKTTRLKLDVLPDSDIDVMNGRKKV